MWIVRSDVKSGPLSPHKRARPRPSPHPPNTPTRLGPTLSKTNYGPRWATNWHRKFFFGLVAASDIRPDCEPQEGFVTRRATFVRFVRSRHGGACDHNVRFVPEADVESAGSPICGLRIRGPAGDSFAFYRVCAATIAPSASDQSSIVAAGPLLPSRPQEPLRHKRFISRSCRRGHCSSRGVAWR